MRFFLLKAIKAANLQLKKHKNNYLNKMSCNVKSNSAIISASLSTIHKHWLHG